MTCISINFMNLFIPFIIVCFVFHCLFMLWAFGRKYEWVKKNLCDAFTENSSKYKDWLAWGMILGSTLYMTFGIMIIVMWLHYNWYIIATYLPCIVIV